MSSKNNSPDIFHLRTDVSSQAVPFAIFERMEATYSDEDNIDNYRHISVQLVLHRTKPLNTDTLLLTVCG